MNKYETKYFNTAKKMNDALIHLLLKKDFEYISIKDICLQAKVNRSTFYLHYENTYDLLEEVIVSLNNSFNESFKNIKPINIKNSDKERLFFITDEYLLPYLNFIKDNKQIYKSINSNPSIFNSDKTYEKMLNELFFHVLDKYNIKQNQKKYIIDFYISGINSIILSWCHNDCKEDVLEISSLLKKLINDK